MQRRLPGQWRQPDNTVQPRVPRTRGLHSERVTAEAVVAEAGAHDVLGAVDVTQVDDDAPAHQD